MNKKINTSLALAIMLVVASALALIVWMTNRAEAPGETNGGKETAQKMVPENNKTAEDEKASSENLTKDWLDFENNKFGYKIKFSREMTVNDKNLDDVMISLPIASDVIIPFEIMVIPTGENYDLDAILKKALAKELGGGRSLNKEEIMVDGEKGYALSNCGKFECITQRWAVVKNGRLYLLRSVDGLPKDFERMFSTFRFISPNDVSEWKTYRNDKYGFEFEYLNKLKIADIKKDDSAKYPLSMSVGIYPVDSEFNKHPDSQGNISIYVSSDSGFQSYDKEYSLQVEQEKIDKNHFIIKTESSFKWLCKGGYSITNYLYKSCTIKNPKSNIINVYFVFADNYLTNNEFESMLKNFTFD